MPYSAEISRANPSCFLFVLDQSGSMSDAFPGGKSKAQGVADALNKLLSDLCIKCAKEEGIRDYYHLGVIGYGANVGSAFSGPLAGKQLVPISEVANQPARLESRAKKIEDGAGGLVDQTVRFPIWVDPVSNGGTPMRAALGQATSIIQGWLSQRPTCFPPVVMHFTDGESTDGDPSGEMQSLTSLQSNDGNVLLFNVHISGNPSATPITFPNTADQLPDQYAKMLFNGASMLTPHMQQVAREQGLTVDEGAKGFALNAGLETVILTLDIGTRPSNLR